MTLTILILLAAVAIVASGLACALLARDGYESACTGNCNQGRNCTCGEPKRGYSTEQEEA